MWDRWAPAAWQRFQAEFDGVVEPEGIHIDDLNERVFQNAVADSDWTMVELLYASFRRIERRCAAALRTALASMSAEERTAVLTPERRQKWRNCIDTDW